MPPKKKARDDPPAPAAAAAKKKPVKKADADDEEVEAPVARKSSSGPALTEEAILAGTVPFVRRTADKDFDAATTLKFISWNVAGLRALLKKDGEPLLALVKKESPDVLCLQETKLSDAKEATSLGVIDGYEFVDSISTEKKGYSGTRTYVKKSLLTAATHFAGFSVAKPTPDPEGRVLTTVLRLGKAAEKKDGGGGGLTLALVNSYVPNSGMTLERLDYRVDEYDPLVRRFLTQLNAHVGVDTTADAAAAAAGTSGVIWTGDLNVAERDYDRYFAGTFKAMQKVPGFTPEERASFRTTLAETKMVDSFRALYPNAHKAYTFWSNKFNNRAKGNGWRLDYFVVSAAIASRVVDSFMLPQYEASDHCPLVLWLRK